MNKFLLGTLLASFTLSAAAAENQKPKEQTQAPTRPTLALTVFDVSTSVARNLNTTTLSRSAKYQRLCWAAMGFEMGSTANIVETIHSPKGGNFSAPGANVSSMQDGTIHVVTQRKQPTHDAKFIDSCWVFSEQDPVGDYTVEVQIDDVKFPALKYKIVE